MKALVVCWSPYTNTLLLPHGEVPISLWDMYKLVGFLVAGHLMDVVIPSAECLSSSLDKSDRIPESCCFLLHAYHHLVSSYPDHSVFVANWIGLWSALPQGYTRPLTAEDNLAGSLSLPPCPRGSIPTHGSRND
ncbi:hypothetical protein LIER_27118 [Lithospermum erythrorhizon]|uniref:Aminotransferase-like plant mobile domain-containing protein n=1 Tax=Lithospermum erythrorhizon TaxID=34254 RepID=A0AAV3RDY4_LITER